MPSLPAWQEETRMNETTITRRSALRTTTLTALGIGLMGAAGARPEPVAAASSATLATVVDAADLAAECRATWAEFKERSDVALALGRQHDAVSTPEQQAAFMEWEAASNDAKNAESDWQAAELARHLPGVAPVIQMLWRHITSVSYGQPGACCTPDAGYEP
jgi:hypothetical protein